jgi:hypothetical protein
MDFALAKSTGDRGSPLRVLFGQAQKIPHLTVGDFQIVLSNTPSGN